MNVDRGGMQNKMVKSGKVERTIIEKTPMTSDAGEDKMVKKGHIAKTIIEKKELRPEEDTSNTLAVGPRI